MRQDEKAGDNIPDLSFKPDGSQLSYTAVALRAALSPLSVFRYIVRKTLSQKIIVTPKFVPGT